MEKTYMHIAKHSGKDKTLEEVKISVVASGSKQEW